MTIKRVVAKARSGRASGSREKRCDELRLPNELNVVILACYRWSEVMVRVEGQVHAYMPIL